MTNMKNHFSVVVAAMLLLSCAQLPAQTDSSLTISKAKREVMAGLEQKAPLYTQVAQQIWNWAEVGYQEYKSSGLLQQTLKDAGFQVKSGVAEIPTAFVAEYGSGHPIIGILAEFDALPGVSQDASSSRSVRKEVDAGHACGHHLFGSASVAAAIAVRDWLQRSGAKGTVRLYGTPAEEGGAGKVYMVRAGLFDDVDGVLHWHAADRNAADASSSLSNKSAKFRFYGIASHAAGSPEKGRSALDGVEALDYMVNMMREHVPSEARIHYVITEGGKAPNVVPEFAEVFYYVRHPEMQTVRDLFERVVKAAEGAALGTETRMEYEVIHGLYNVLPNETMSRYVHRNLTAVGGVQYDATDKAFAAEIRKSYETKRSLESAAAIEPFQVVEKGSGGSTDVGDISWMVPTAGMVAATWVPGTSAHSWQAVAAGGTPIGWKGMMVAAKTLALSAMDFFEHPEVLNKAKEELLRRRGDNFKYDPLIGNRKPPLDYRN